MNIAALIGIVSLVAAAIPSLALAGLLHADAQASAVQRDIARLTSPYAPPRQDLTGEQEPVPTRRVPGRALAANGFVDTPAPAYTPPPPAVLERALAGLRGLDSERVNNEYEGRHRWGTAEGSCAQVARMRALRIPTDQWNTLVAPLTAGWCDSCSPGRERERPHQSCPGCPCPCRHPHMLIGQPGMDLVS